MTHLSPELWTLPIWYGSRNSNVPRGLRIVVQWGSAAHLGQATGSDLEFVISRFESFRLNRPFRRLVRLPRRRENGPEIPAFHARSILSPDCLDQPVTCASRPGRGANSGSTSTDHKAFSFGSVESSRSGSSRPGISGIALPAIACRSPTIPTVESTTARI